MLKKGLADEQGREGRKMTLQGIRTCGICGKIAGHNARTCMRLKLEDELRQQQLKLQQDAEKTNKDIVTKKQKRQAESAAPTLPRRSNRLK
jgi:hypothetical protein